ncbi:MAG: hypothetical protein IJM30_06515 [Thermoguttaceae bacterium]|nr:hypothetical protein [Thermoguttaceae bacterium]
MPPMTISDFNWSYFWSTIHQLSWLQVLMGVCFAFGWFFSIKKTKKTGVTEGKSALFLLFVFLGFLFGVCYKLFVNLDITVLAYLAFAIAAFVDFWICQRIEAEGATESRRSKLIQRDRARAKSRYSSDSKPSSHRHRHRSRSDGSDRSSSRHSRHRRDVETGRSGEESPEPKEPKYIGDVKLDDESPENDRELGIDGNEPR